LKDLLQGVYKETFSGVFPDNNPCRMEAQSSSSFYLRTSASLL